MKKEALLFTTSFLLILSVSSAYSQKWLWGAESRPGSNSKAQGEIIMDHSIAVDNKGNSYAIGKFSKQMIFGNDTLNSYSISGDFFLVKYNAAGNQVWVNQIMGDKLFASTAKAAGADDSGNSYVTGMFSDSLTFGATHLVSGNGSYDVFVAKYYANGNLAWAKQFNPISMYSSSFGYGVVADRSGNIYLTGLLSDTVSYETDTIKQSSYENFFLAKLNPAGHPLWIRTGDCYGVTSYCNIASLALDQAGNPYIAGTFDDTIILGGTDTLYTRTHDGDLFVAKYDPAGNILWASSPKVKDATTMVFPYSISVDGNGDAYVDGYFQDTVFFGPDMLAETRLNQNAFVSRFSGKNGKPLWGLAPQSTDNTLWQCFSIASDTLKRGGCYIIMEGTGNGRYKFNFGNDTFKLTTPYTGAEAIVQFDSGGRSLCGVLFTEGGEDDGDGIAATPSGNFVCLGGDLFDTTAFGPDTLVYGFDMPFVSCWQPCDANNTSNGINEPRKAMESIRVYPNPFHNATTILVSTEGSHYLEVYDVMGRKLQSAEFNGKQYELSSQGLAQGIYFVRVLDATNTLIGTNKIVVQ